MAMHCERCHALMVEEVFGDARADTWMKEFRGWRCPVCGNVLDPVILANRSALSMDPRNGVRRRHNARAL